MNEIATAINDLSSTIGWCMFWYLLAKTIAALRR